MANNRIYYANQQVAFKKDIGTSWTVAHGVQSIGIATSFSLEQAFELGQLAIYENIEGIPEVECTITKVLDGYELLWRLATAAAGSDDTLVTRAQTETFVALGIWADTDEGVSGNPQQQVEMSGMSVSNVSYSMPVDGNFTESITLVGSDKKWGTSCETSWAYAAAAGGFEDNNDAPIGTGGISRRENFKPHGDGSTLPAEVTGDHIQSVEISADLSRESLFELGSRKPYARVVNFPAEVTCSFEILAIDGDGINALAEGCNPVKPCPGVVANTEDRTIIVALCEGTIINLGTKNRLSSVNYGGGDAGGGNATVTYTYTTYNDFTVDHLIQPT